MSQDDGDTSIQDATSDDADNGEDVSAAANAAPAAEAGDGDATDGAATNALLPGGGYAGFTHRVGQLWAGAADVAEATVTSGVHVAEYGYDRATGDDVNAEKRMTDMEGDLGQLQQGGREIGEGMGL